VDIMRIIYEPTGKAFEYAPLAASLYKGCDHGCTYCFAPDITRTEREEFLMPYQRKDALKNFEKDCADLEKAGDTREILLSFTTDPYQPIEKIAGLTHAAIKILHMHNRPYSILTKGGARSMVDIPLMAERKDLSRYATTLTLYNGNDEKKWEQNAAPSFERVAALCMAHNLGIQTWVSIEPIIDPEQSLWLIEHTATIGCVDLYRIGKMNHMEPGFNERELYEFCRNAKIILEKYNRKYVFKNEMAQYLPKMG
jgi:DNA repair photolyase